MVCARGKGECTNKLDGTDAPMQAESPDRPLLDVLRGASTHSSRDSLATFFIVESEHSQLPPPPEDHLRRPAALLQLLPWQLTPQGNQRCYFASQTDISTFFRTEQRAIVVRGCRQKSESCPFLLVLLLLPIVTLEHFSCAANKVQAGSANEKANTTSPSSLHT